MTGNAQNIVRVLLIISTGLVFLGIGALLLRLLGSTLTTRGVAGSGSRFLGSIKGFVQAHPWWTAFIVLPLPFWIIALAWALPAWGNWMVYAIVGETKSAQAAHVAPVTPVDQSNIRLDYFVEGPQKWGWETLPTEVEVTLPFDGKPRYTGLNVALMEGSKVRISCPGYPGDGVHTIYHREGDGKWFHLHRSEEELVVDGFGSLHGTYMARGRAIPGNSGSIHYTMEAIPKAGHTRIATWKMAEGGKNLHWGDLPSPEKFAWNLYFRFADEHGITLKSSVMQEYPATIHISGKVTKTGKSSAGSPRIELIPLGSKVLSESERVLGQNMVTEVSRFLTISPPEIPDQKVRVEVILDIVRR